MKQLILAFFVLTTTLAEAQVNWQETTDWKIYNPGRLNIFTTPLDSLVYLRSRALAGDSVRQFLDSVKALPSVIRPAWMGGFLVTYIFHGDVRKIEVSSYGGFFYDQRSKTYFQLPAGKKDEWFTYLDDCFSAIESSREYRRISL
jgi:hypothetical protein